MNAAQIHLALNHAPLFFSGLGGLILILGLVRKNELFKTTSLYLLVAGAIFTAPVFLTGEGTEELIENLPGVNDPAIETHENMAKISMIIIAISGLVALGALLLRKRMAILKPLLGVALLLSLASFGTMAYTAHLGGLIRHGELQNSVAATGEKDNGQEAGGKEDKKKDEDD